MRYQDDLQNTGVAISDFHQILIGGFSGFVNEFHIVTIRTWHPGECRCSLAWPEDIWGGMALRQYGRLGLLPPCLQDLELQSAVAHPKSWMSAI